MIYTNKKFKGYWPIRTAAIVEADSIEEAAELLEMELAKIGLGENVFVHDMEEYKGGIVILNDGNY